MRWCLHGHVYMSPIGRDSCWCAKELFHQRIPINSIKESVLFVYLDVFPSIFLTGLIFFCPILDRSEFSFQLFEASIIHVIFSLIPAFTVGKMLTFFHNASFEWWSHGLEISVLLVEHRKGKSYKYFSNSH